MIPHDIGAKSRLFKRAFVIGGVALIASVATFAAMTARAAGIPAATALTYTGYLETPDGTPLTKASSVSLNVWNAATGGKKVCATEPESITPVAGRFQITLPDVCTTAVSASPDLWLEATVDGTSLGRTKLGAVPYAVEAAHAASAASADDATGALATRLDALDKGVAKLAARLDNARSLAISKYDVDSDVTVTTTNWTWVGGTDQTTLAPGRYWNFVTSKLNTVSTGCTAAPDTCKTYAGLKVAACLKVADKIVTTGTPIHYETTKSGDALGMEVVAFDSFDIALATAKAQFGMCAARAVEPQTLDTRVRSVQASVWPQLD